MKTKLSYVKGLSLSAGVTLAFCVSAFAAVKETSRIPVLNQGMSPAENFASDFASPDKKPDADTAYDREIKVAQAAQTGAETSEAEKTAPESAASDKDAVNKAEKEADKMNKEAGAEPTDEEKEAFRQTMHEGDIALGVCGARVSALMWFYEASIAQGREDLKAAVASLKESRESLKNEAERRALEDGVDTSVRVMNSESEKLWKDLNDKADGDTAEFQKAHDELFVGVQECLALFFERPDDAGK